MITSAWVRSILENRGFNYLNGFNRGTRLRAIYQARLRRRFAAAPFQALVSVLDRFQDGLRGADMLSARRDDRPLAHADHGETLGLEAKYVYRVFGTFEDPEDRREWQQPFKVLSDVPLGAQTIQRLAFQQFSAYLTRETYQNQGDPTHGREYKPDSYRLTDAWTDADR
jgi:hypothetical protein